MKEEKTHSNDTKIAILETQSNYTHETLNEIKAQLKHMEINNNIRFDRIEDRFDKINDRFNRIDDRIDNKEISINSRFDRLENRIWSLHIWNLTQLIGILYLIARAFHWVT